MIVLSDLLKDSRSAFKSHSPTFTYTSGILTRIDYSSDSSYKLFIYANGLLDQIDHVYIDRTIRKNFNYVSGNLTSITETVV
jgi:hypothetical protein